MNGISLLKCICDETRFEILELLQKNKELCVNDFVKELAGTQVWNVWKYVEIFIFSLHHAGKCQIAGIISDALCAK